jgi:hypothetical protein
MRLRSLNTISLLILLAGLLSMAAAWPLRHMLLLTFLPDRIEVDFRELAEANPDDADIWLPALVEEPYQDMSLEERERTYRRAAELAPTSAAPHVMFAMFALKGVGLNREEENAFYYYEESDLLWEWRTHERYLRRSQRQRLSKARAALDRAAGLDPENAAIDALRVSIALTEHDEAKAFELLRSTLGKRKWTLYRTDVQNAAHSAARRFAPPDVAAFSGTTAFPGSMFQARFRALGRLLVGFANLAEGRGDHGQAVFLRRTVMHLGALVLSGDSDILDAMTGWVICDMGGTKPLDEADIARLHSASDSPETDDPVSARERAEARRHAGAMKLAEYLRAHDEVELADDVMAWAEAREEWHMQSLAVLARRSHWSHQWMAADFAMKQAARALGACLAALLLLGIAALPLRWSGRSPQSVAWSPIGWILVIYGCLAVVYVVGLYGSRGQRVNLGSESPNSPTPVSWTCPAWGDYFAVIGVPLILLCVAAIVMLHRRRHPEVRREGPVRQYVGTAAAVLLPVSALLCLSTGGFTVAGAAATHRQADVQRAIMEQGELKYYDLTVPLPQLQD